MSADKISVRLVSRAKVDGRWCEPGHEVHVDLATAAQLEAASAIQPVDGAIAELVSGAPTFDQEVAAMAKMLADAAVKAAVETATEELLADRDAARARLHEVEAENRSLQARNFELEAEIAELKTAAAAAPQDPPAADAPQKGAAAKKG